MDIWTLAFAIIALIFGVVVGYLYRKSNHEKEIAGAKNTASQILEDARKEAETTKREAMLEAKDENHKYRSEIEDELRERRGEVQKQENRSIQREENLDRKDTSLSKREQSIESKEDNLVKRQNALVSEENRIQALVEEQQHELERIATLSREDARNIIMDETENQLSHEIAVMIRESDQKRKMKQIVMRKTLSCRRFKEVQPIWFRKQQFQLLHCLTMT